MAQFNSKAYEKARVSAFGLTYPNTAKGAGSKAKQAIKNAVAKKKKPTVKKKPSYTPYKYPNT